jgi:hypothetical protein
MSTPDKASQETQPVNNAPKRGKKYFTLEEANRAVPYVSRIVADAAERFTKVVALKNQAENAPTRTDRERAETEHDVQLEKLVGYVQELQHVGVEIRDLERGLLDFPAVYEGREICLCWLAGEDKVDAWHEVDAGFAGRQALGSLKE